MKEFFNKYKIIIIISIFSILISIILGSIILEKNTILGNKFYNSIIIPLQKEFSNINNKINKFFDPIVNYNSLKKENEELLKENIELTNRLINFEDIKNENYQLKQIIDIEENNPNLELYEANIIGEDINGMIGTYTIDIGKNFNVKERSSVIVGNSLFGVVTYVGDKYSKVTSILSPDLNVGSYEIRTGENGIVSGDPTLYEQNKCKLTYIENDTLISAGDIIVTSGDSGKFPSGLVIGSVEEILQNKNNSTIYATINPPNNLSKLTNIFVVNNF